LHRGAFAQLLEEFITAIEDNKKENAGDLEYALKSWVCQMQVVRHMPVSAYQFATSMVPATLVGQHYAPA